jgi:glycosyltransferase involved in cell wall biosynthesis
MNLIVDETEFVDDNAMRNEHHVDSNESPVPSGDVAVSVVVPCRNEINAIDDFLESALAQTGVDGGFEIVVADGLSDDGTRERLDARARSDARLRVVSNPERIVSTGLNRAIRASRGQVVVRMDVHSEYAPDYLAECLRILQSSGADNVGGPARTRARTYFQRANAAAYQSWFSVGGARFHDPHYSGPVDTVPYGCWRRQTLLDTGLFDERLVRNQDDEFNLRLIRRGGRIWQSSTICSWYYPRSSFGALFRQYYQYGYWKVPVIRKHRMPASWRQVTPFGMVIAGISLAILGFVVPWAWSVLMALVTAYMALSLAASVQAAGASGDYRLGFILPFIFLAYHVSYGAGFSLGLVDAVTGRLPSKPVTSLSR